ncbi:hypothetical protein DXG01_006644 [Tephrocybe rancida]|nr:hypothetical protein DXG01_006644 [Tephrocybe rancida]
MGSMPKTPGKKKKRHLGPFSASRRTYISKKECAMIRILSKYGISRGAIGARNIGVSVTTVGKVLNNANARQNMSDWNEVDEFKDYPPASVPFSSPPSFSPHGSDNSFDVPATAPTSSEGSFEHTVAIMLSFIKLLGIKEDIMRFTSGASTIILVREQSTSSYQPTLPFIVDSKPQACRNKKERSEEEMVVDVEHPLPDLATFLEGLEHDLDELLDTLQEQDLRTNEELFAFSHWPEERLHKMLKETLPQITVLQRFMLIHGMKAYA